MGCADRDARSAFGRVRARRSKMTRRSAPEDRRVLRLVVVRTTSRCGVDASPDVRELGHQTTEFVAPEGDDLAVGRTRRRRGVIATFEHLPKLNLGLGASSGFTPDNHNYSKSVFGTAITADGGFVDRYFWSDGSSIQLFE